MKKNTTWKISLLLGICPFAVPVVLGLYRMTIETWTLMDWLVLYSFIYWPTYIIGLVLIAVALALLLKKGDQWQRKNLWR